VGRAESNGMFLDEGTTGITIEGNVIYNIARSPLRFHRAGNNLVRDNTLTVFATVPPVRYNRTKDALIKKVKNKIITFGSDPENSLEKAIESIHRQAGMEKPYRKKVSDYTGTMVIHQNFSEDPGWEGYNNRVQCQDCPTITQDFGWNPTNHNGDGVGEIGGVIWKSTTPAYYAMPIGPFSFKDKLTASGKIAVAFTSVFSTANARAGGSGRHADFASGKSGMAGRAFIWITRPAKGRAPSSTRILKSPAMARFIPGN